MAGASTPRAPTKATRALEDKGAMSKARETQGKEGQPNFIPGEAPVGEPGRKK